MQKEGTVRFLKEQAPVKAVAFSPVDRHLFVSGGNDGRINFYNAYHTSFHHLLISHQLNPNAGRSGINAVKFTSDGRRVATVTSSRKLAVIDVERGEPTHFYDNCCYTARDRVPLVMSPYCPHLIISSTINGKGLAVFDLRMPLPVDFLMDIHDSIIRDAVFLDKSWPFVNPFPCALATVSYDGTLKVCSMEGKVIHCLHVGHFTNCLASTPEPYTATNKNGFQSVLMLAGDQLSTYTPEKEPTSVNKFSLTSTTPSLSSVQLPPPPHHHLFSQRVQQYSPNSFYSSFQSNLTSLSVNMLQPTFSSRNFPLTLNSLQSSGFSSPRQSHLYNMFQAKNCAVQTMPLAQSLLKMKYTLNGGLLYAISEDNSIKKLRRYPNEHRIVSDVMTHKSEIYDMDISPYDEFLVTASRDKTVGVLYLGPPNRGCTVCVHIN